MRTPVVLAGVLAIVLASATWYQYSHLRNVATSQYQAKNPMVLPTPETQVSMIQIKNAQGVLELKCESLAQKNCTYSGVGTWKILSPTSAQNVPVNGAAVKEFFHDLMNNYPAEPVDLSVETPEKRKALWAEYGLSEELRAKPEMVSVTLALIDEKGASLGYRNEWFGNEDALGLSVFVGSGVDGKLNEQKVFVLHKRLKKLTNELTTRNFL